MKKDIFLQGKFNLLTNSKTFVMENFEISLLPYIYMGTVLVLLMILVIGNFEERLFIYGAIIIKSPKKSHKPEIIWLFCQLKAGLKMIIWLVKYPLWFLPRNK